MAFKGCPACARRGRAVAFVCDPVRYEPVEAVGSGPGIWRWGETLPVAGRHAVSLGEGDTPLLSLPRVALDVGVHDLYVKNEAVGSPPVAVDAYRTIAYEICEQLGGRAPDWVVIPVSYGDCLAGVQRGFAHMAETGRIERPPRLAAVEPHGALGRVLAAGVESQEPVPVPPDTAASSLAVRYTTDQAVRARKAANGVAVTVPEDELLHEQHRFARLSPFRHDRSAGRRAELHRVDPERRTTSSLRDRLASSRAAR